MQPFFAFKGLRIESLYFYLGALSEPSDFLNVKGPFWLFLGAWRRTSEISVTCLLLPSINGALSGSLLTGNFAWNSLIFDVVCPYFRNFGKLETLYSYTSLLPTKQVSRPLCYVKSTLQNFSRLVQDWFFWLSSRLMKTLQGFFSLSKTF